MKKLSLTPLPFQTPNSSSYTEPEYLNHPMSVRSKAKGLESLAGFNSTSRHVDVFSYIKSIILQRTIDVS
ncbi:MAG: hypothetical protein ACFFFG_11890 [Candidatus Thorarchaeota archaeon]